MSSWPRIPDIVVQLLPDKTPPKLRLRPIIALGSDNAFTFSEFGHANPSGSVQVPDTMVGGHARVLHGARARSRPGACHRLRRLRHCRARNPSTARDRMDSRRGSVGWSTLASLRPRSAWDFPCPRSSHACRVRMANRESGILLMPSSFWAPAQTTACPQLDSGSTSLVPRVR
jgi:hypothetical protein